MRIGPVELHGEGPVRTLRATITWEQASRPPFEARITLASPIAEGVPIDPAPFVPAAAIAAELHGEERLEVADPVDPHLVAGVDAALALLRSWFGPGRSQPRFEATDRHVAGDGARRTACLLTGGVDSTALLVDNHRRYPPGHPMRVQAGVVVYGLDPSTTGDVLAPDQFLGDLAVATGIELIALDTNLREIEPSWAAWRDRLQAALLVGVAHAAAHRFGRLLIAASDSYPDLVPYGSHPMLDPLFGSSAVVVHHELAALNRFERTRLVAATPAALASLQVCNEPRDRWAPGRLNCGSCEKCVRTRIGLLAAGVVEPPTFPPGPVTPALVDAIAVPGDVKPLWAELVGPLRHAGEPALATAVERRSRPGAVDRLKALDGRRFAGRLRSAARRLRGRAAAGQ